MRKRHLYIFLFLLILSINGSAQKTFRVMSYNVENLFDCIHDSLKNDQEFLPDAAKGWNNTKYYEKLNHIAKVIIDAAPKANNPVVLIGLCEVENDNALTALTRKSVLRNFKYRYVMTNSPDERGIDVALLYQKRRFKLLDKQCIRVTPGVNGEKINPTRDILHVVGRLQNKDTLDVFVCHWPSRSGGEMASRPAR